jgi:rod shape-determining protein MreC
MFSRNTVLILAALLLVTVNLIFLAVTARRPEALGFSGRTLGFVAPFQELAARAVEGARGVWRHYFSLVGVSYENERLVSELARERERLARQREVELENERLRSLLGFARTLPQSAVAAEIVAKDPSPWFKTVIINKGRAEGLRRGLPAVTAQGVAGRIVEAGERQSKLMLIIDRNSAADALVQRSRARGIVKGASAEECYLDYVMHEEDVRPGDEVVTSGLDGVFPKGLRIGTVAAVSFQGTDFFKEVRIVPAVNFERLEEVLVILDTPPESRTAIQRR